MCQVSDSDVDNFRDKSTGSRWQWGGAAQGSGLVKPSLMSDMGAERMSPGHLGGKAFQVDGIACAKAWRREKQRWKIGSK